MKGRLPDDPGDLLGKGPKCAPCLVQSVTPTPAGRIRPHF